MTHTPDEPDEPTENGQPAHDPGAGRKLDEDAAWREIVENYGERARLEPEEPEESSDPPPQPSQPSQSPRPSEPADEQRLRGLFQPTWDDPLNTETGYDDEGHFVPPTPPPPPVPSPRRRLAWMGLFGAPLVMLLAVVLGWSLPEWFLLFLAGGFVGGFVYLVATMPQRGPGHGGDDGAVV